MKNSLINVNQRRDFIFNLLLKHKYVEVKDIAAKCKVSELTIRRDLEFFEHKSLIERYYGGARLIEDSSADQKSHQLNITKEAIAKTAAKYIDSGDTIFINTSSTALLVIKYLNTKQVTIITNSTKALTMNNNPNATIILSGGEVYPKKDSMVGDFALNNLTKIHVSKSILGCSALSLNEGLTTSIHSEVSLNQTMLKNTKGLRIIALDSSKINKVASYVTASLSDIDMIITDKKANHEDIEKIKQKYLIKVILV